MEVHANQFTGGRIKAMNRNPDTVQEAAARRKGETEDGTSCVDLHPIPLLTHHKEQAFLREREHPVQPHLVLNVLQNPHNLMVERPEGSKGGKSSKGKRVSKGQVQGQVQRQEQGEELTRF